MSGYLQKRQALKLGLVPPVVKEKKPIPKKSVKKIEQEAAERQERGEQETELQKWYSHIMQTEHPVCWETGEKIDTRDVKGWHGSIAHALPKIQFPSVATHPKNYLILKMWGGTHGQYDSSWENASRMKVWPIACEVFNQLYPLLSADEKRRLPDVIVQEIRPEVYNS